MAKPKVGSGQRFAALENKLAGRPGVYNPAGLTAAIGRKKYGSGEFARLAAKGRKKRGKGKGDNPSDSPAVERAERASGKAT